MLCHVTSLFPVQSLLESTGHFKSAPNFAPCVQKDIADKQQHNNTQTQPHSRYRACLSLFACVFVYTLIHKHRKKKKKIHLHELSLPMSQGIFLVLVEAVVLIQGTAFSCVRALALCFFVIMCCLFWKSLLTHALSHFLLLVCVGVNVMLRKIAVKAASKPLVEITQDGETLSIKTSTTVRTTHITFTVGQEFNETTVDGRPCTVHKIWT